MSAGQLSRSRYEDDNGNIWKIRVQPETEGLTIDGVANAAPTGAFTAGFPSAQVSRGRQSIGINARLCRIKFNTTVPPGYDANGSIALPVLTQAAKAAFVSDAEGTYTLDGTAYDVTVIGTTPEKIR
jgi:hypothetical protein